MTVQARLSREQYLLIRKAVKDLRYNIFPRYTKIQDAKKKCYPDNFKITEISAVVPLQHLLEHTARRIIESKPDQDLENLSDYNLVLHTKWGCDGASGQSEFQQKFYDNVDGASDVHLFMTSIVPLKLTSNNDEVCIWSNNRPSSTNYCRPLQFQYRPETPELIRAEKHKVDEEIRNLSDSTVIVGERIITVRHALYFTMIDGKVAQVVTDTPSASNCIVCGAKPSQLNDLSKLGVTSGKEEVLKLGMSPLHARLRFMEYILKIGYNLSFKSWKSSTATKPMKLESRCCQTRHGHD